MKLVSVLVRLVNYLSMLVMVLVRLVSVLMKLVRVLTAVFFFPTDLRTNGAMGKLYPIFVSPVQWSGRPLKTSRGNTN